MKERSRRVRCDIRRTGPAIAVFEDGGRGFKSGTESLERKLSREDLWRTLLSNGVNLCRPARLFRML